MSENVATNQLAGDASVEGERARLSLRGALATRTVDQADAYLHQLRGRGIRELEIDLSGLTRLDSSGLAFLLRVHHRAGEMGWALSMTEPPAHLRNQMARLGLDTRLPFVQM